MNLCKTITIDKKNYPIEILLRNVIHWIRNPTIKIHSLVAQV